VAGKMLSMSASIAVDEINAGGGIHGKKIEIITEDTANDSKKAVGSYQNLKSKGVRYFIGESSPVIVPIRPLAIADRNLLISSSAVAPSFSDNEVLSCRFALTSPNIGSALVNLLISNNYRTVSLLLPNSEYGKSLSIELAKYAQKVAVNILYTEFYSVTDTSDYRTNITKIVSRQKDSNALIIINNSNSIEAMLGQLKQLGWKKPMVSDNATINNPSIKNTTLIEGIEYVDYGYSKLPSKSDSVETRSFKEKYKELSGSDAAYIPAGHYDAIKLLAHAIGEVGDDPQKVAQFISTLHDYHGITGSLSFNTDCEATRTNFYRKFEKGTFVEIK
jgi:branched-chain amino acid transport system substrate-binding protein